VEGSGQHVVRTVVTQRPQVRRAEDVESEPVDAADGLSKAILVGEEHVVSAGDALHIPAGTVHWYRNEADREGTFVCAVPAGDDSIELVEK